jgi:hypothetical protein
MQKNFTKILSLILLATFLVSFTGLRIQMHECATCNSREISFFGEAQSCCSSSENASSDEGSCALPLADNATSCCDIPEEETAHAPGCCTDEVLYVFNDYEFAKEKQHQRVEPLVITCVALLANSFDASDLSVQKQLINPGDDSPPPLNKAGKDFVLFTHQLKIS